MKYIINKVRNVFDHKKGYKVQLTYNNNKTKSFGINVEESGFKTTCESKNEIYSIKGLEDCLSTELDNNYDTAFETKQLLVQSIDFVKEKIKRLSLSGEQDYIINGQYIFIDSLKKILSIINKELSFVEKQSVLAPVYK